MIRLLLLGAFTLVFATATLGQVGRQPSAPANKPLTFTQIWKLHTTYTDSLNGVTFRYPSVWQAETQFGYHPPALTQSDAQPIAGFGYEERGFPRHQVIGAYSATDLEGFGVVYSAVPATNATECESLAMSLSAEPSHRTVVFAGRSYSEHRVDGAGMSQSIVGSLYITYARPTCYLFETDVTEAYPDAKEGINALTPGQLKSIDTHLLNIMKSVRIVSPKQQLDASEGICAQPNRLKTYSNASFIEEAGDVVGYEFVLQRPHSGSIHAFLYDYEGVPNAAAISLSGRISGTKVTMEGDRVQHLIEQPSGKEIVETSHVGVEGILGSTWFRGTISIGNNTTPDHVQLKRVGHIWTCKSSIES
jgi:hypothetical protein